MVSVSVVLTATVSAVATSAASAAATSTAVLVDEPPKCYTHTHTIIKPTIIIKE